MAKSIQYQQFQVQPGMSAIQQIQQLQSATPYQYEFTDDDAAVDTEWVQISAGTGYSTTGILVACATLTVDGEITESYTIDPNYNYAVQVGDFLGATPNPPTGTIPSAIQTIKKVAADVTTTGQTLVDITGLSFAIAAGESWQVDFYLCTGSSSADGVEIGINIPANVTMLVKTLGSTTGVTAFSTDAITADATAGLAYNTANAATGFIEGHGIITSSTGAGTVALQFLKVVSGTATILANSHLIARRIS